MAKLIVIADHAILHDGRFPDNQTLRNLGHGLGNLLDACEKILAEYPADPAWGERPRDAIHEEIITTLNEFATLSRYYNLDSLSGATASRVPEPIGAWWRRVGAPILQRHYTPRMRARDELEAGFMEALFNDRATVLHFNEAEEPIQSVTALLLRAGAARVVQRYGRMYSLQIVRWLVEGLSVIARSTAGRKEIDALMGLDEPYVLFRNEDDYLRNRKTWSIYRP